MPAEPAHVQYLIDNTGHGYNTEVNVTKYLLHTVTHSTYRKTIIKHN